MNCQHCESRLNASIQSGGTFHQCERCLGLFVYTAELQAVLSGVASMKLEKRKVEPATESESNDCPGCERVMEPFEYAHDSGVVVQKCKVCNAIWIENGQLKELARHRQGTPAERNKASVLAENLQLKSQPPRFLGKMTRMLLTSKWFSLAVAAACVAFCGYRGGVFGAVRMAIVAVIALFAIWFSELIGRTYTYKYEWSPIPGDIFVLFGWLLLLLFFAVFTVFPPMHLRDFINTSS